MKHGMSMLSLVVVGLFAAAAPALGYGPGPQAGMGPRAAAPLDPAQRAERVQARLDAMKSELKLAPSQLVAWNAYAAKVAEAAQARAQLRQSMHGDGADAQATADQHVALMKYNAQAADEINALRKALVATLSPEQKATFEQSAPGPGQGRGMRGPGGGFGMGHGPGGRGMGPGCAGAA